MTDDVANLIRTAGRREAPDAASREAARAAVRRSWQDSVAARRRRRWLAAGVPALAAAAALALFVWPGGHRTGDAPVAVARVAVSTAAAYARTANHERTLAAGDHLYAGDTLDTSPGQVVSLSLEGGGEIRQNSGSSTRWSAPQRLTLVRGQIYVDSGGAPSALTIETVAGLVRDIGTRFDVQVGDGAVRVRVRDGAVRLESPSGAHEAAAGREILARAGQTVIDRPTTSYGPEWNWILRATAFHLDGSTAAGFLQWIEREGGRTVVFAEPRLRDEAAATVLHGSVRNLTIDEALETVLPAAGLAYRADGARLVIRRVGDRW